MTYVFSQTFGRYDTDPSLAHWCHGDDIAHRYLPQQSHSICIMEKALYTDGSHSNRILSVSWRRHCTQMVPTAISFYCIMERALYTDGSHNNLILSVSWRGHCTQMVPTTISLYCVMEITLNTDGSHSNLVLLCHGDNIEHRWFPQQSHSIVSWRGHCTQMVPTAISFYCIMERALYTDRSHSNLILSFYTDRSHSNPVPSVSCR